MYDKNNIFAKIIRGEIPCDKVYEDDDVLFFKDINPIAKVHVLGIPKSQCVDFSDFISKNTPTTISAFFKKTNFVIEKLGITKDGYKVISNSGMNGGQEVLHFHIHILGIEVQLLISILRSFSTDDRGSPQFLALRLFQATKQALDIKSVIYFLVFEPEKLLLVL